MPAVRPLTEVTRYDAKFFADIVVPALRAVGFEASIALAPDDADVVIEASDTELDALLAGKQKSELSPLDRLKAEKAARTMGVELNFGVVVRGNAGDLRALVVALTPKAERARVAKDIGAEAGSTPRAKRPDRVRRADGRYIKGRPSGRRSMSSAQAAQAQAQAQAQTSAAAASVAAAQAAGVVDTSRKVPADRVDFALANLRGFVEAGLTRLAKLGPVDEDDALTIKPGEVRRG